MKKIIRLPLIVFLAVSIVANAGTLPNKNQALRSLSMKNFENENKASDFSSAKKTISGLTNLRFRKNIRIRIITQGLNAKMKISKGIYPECYPARFSLKLYYSF
ncbi:MAG: hypothetical protein EPN85_09080 [Bacteroidetes bacterium]|nr:MAG: hypothetical protein EPN85_09080 [Bacteroidota bacterium]